MELVYLDQICTGDRQRLAMESAFGPLWKRDHKKTRTWRGNLVAIAIKHMVHVERGSPRRASSLDDGKRRTAVI